MGGTVPGSFDITAKEHFGEGLRIPPVRIVDRGVLRKDLVQLLVSNTRAPAACEGDLHAQVEATAVGMRGVQRLVSRYGLSAVLAAFDDVQDYVEQVARNRIAQLPDGSWETTDYLDSDPDLGEGLIPIRVKLTVSGDQLHYDLSGSHPCVGTFLNSSAGSSFSAVIAGTKTFFPDVPLNSGFYRAVTVDLGPEGTVVNAPWPIAVTGFCSGPFEKIMNAIFEIWSGLMPERALACSFNLEYLLVGGWDVRAKEREYFMWYDWMAGGWGGRNGRDGINCTAPVFGAGLAVQPLEGQERLSPVLTTGHQIRTDSGGPGAHRGGCGVEKGAVLTDAERTVISYSCDRARSLTWGLSGGLPSIPHGTWLKRAGSESATYLGASFSGVPLHPGDMFTRPSAGGGGFGDPLDRPREQVLEDVIDGYVSIERAALDYGVVVMAVDAEVCEYEIDVASTAELRADIRASRHGWLEADAETVAAQYRNGEISMLDVIRRFGVILHWETGELFRKSTKTFREQMKKRSASHWDPAPV